MTASEATELIKEIIDSNCELNEWESGFIKSLGDWVDAGRNPTIKQADKLQQVYDKCVNGEDDWENNKDFGID